jgi:nucleoside-diphosphate-sugar epimerase
MRVAILGASGFVGGHLLRGLRAAGIEARAVVRNPRKLVGDPDRRIADISDVYSVREAIVDCDAVVHAALGTNELIVQSIAPVYAASQAMAVRRLVYVSSGSVHGQRPSPGTNEDSPLHVRHVFAYNNAKVRAERKLRALRTRGTVETVILRPTIVYGAGSRWIFDFADQLLARRACLVDGGRGICNSIYVDNLTHAVALSLTRRSVDGKVFLVGDRERVTWRDLYRPIAEALGFDLDEVPSVSPPPVEAGLRHKYIEPFRQSELGHAVVSHVPRGLKEAVKRFLRIARHNEIGRGFSGPATDGSKKTRPMYEVPPEIAELQRCQWHLPHDRAIDQLGYDPPVSFEEGCRRSVEWLLSRTRGAA